MIEELVYLGHDNEIALQLLAGGAHVNGQAITRTVLLLTRPGATLPIDSLITPSVFDWSRGQGILEMRLGGVAGLTAGRYTARLTVYDAGHSSGLVWGGQFVIKVQ